MDVIPRHNLPPESAPWGTRLQRQQDDLVTAQSRSDQTTNNTLKQLNATVAVLQQQITTLQTTITYLNSLVTYTSIDADITWAGSLTDASYLTGASITFTLTRTSTVLINYNASLGYSWSVPSANSGQGVTYTGSTFVDAVQAGNRVAVFSGAVGGVVASGANQFGGQSFSLTDVITLAAGIHTIAHAYKRSALNVAATSGSRNNAVLSVQVIG